MDKFHKSLLQPFFILLIVGSIVSCKDASTTDANTPASSSNQQTQASSAPQIGDPLALIESRESPYSNIYIYRTGNYISLTFGVNKKIYNESKYNTKDELELPNPYTQFMSSSLIYPNTVKSILEIGSGGGRTAWYLHRSLPDVHITTVEIDPVVIEMAQKYFGIKEEPNFKVVNKDGRLFLANSTAKYDVILLDAYRGPFVPFHLLTKEFYELAKERLAPGGVLAVNIEPTTMLFDSAVNTVHSVFPQIEFYDASGNDVGGSIVLIAHDGQQPVSSSQISEMAEKRQSALKLRYDLREMLTHRFGLKTIVDGDKTYLDVMNQLGTSTAKIDENAKTLSDDFAPVESLKAIARHNQKWTNQANP
jgi:spermidine synthase